MKVKITLYMDINLEVMGLTEEELPDIVESAVFERLGGEPYIELVTVE